MTLSDDFGGCPLSAAARAEIDETFALLEKATLYELLGVTRFASMPEVDAAFEIMTLRFVQGLRADPRRGPWHERTDAILTRLAHAHDVIGNPIRRAGYDALLGAPPGLEGEASNDDGDWVADGIEGPRVLTELGLLGSLFPPSSTLDAETRKPSAHPRAPSRPPRSERPARTLVEAVPPSPPAPEGPILRRPARPSKPPRVSRSSRPVRREGMAVETSRTAGAWPAVQRPTGLDVMEALLRRARERHHGPVARHDARPASPATPTASPSVPEKIASPVRDEAKPTPADAMRALIATAVEHEKAHRWEEAAASWATASAAVPNEPGLKLRGSNALAHAAQASLRSGNALRKALEQARAAVAMAQDNVNAHTTLARVFMMGGLKTSARIALETARYLDPNSKIAHDLLRKINDA